MIYVICNNDAILGYCLTQEEADGIVDALRESSDDPRTYFHWHTCEPMIKIRQRYKRIASPPAA